MPARNHHPRIIQTATRTLCAALLLAVFFMHLPAAPAKAAEPLAPYGGCASWYRVQPGDNLATVSRLFKVPVRILAAANGLTPPYTITPGTWLCIPQHRIVINLRYLNINLSAYLQYLGRNIKSRVVLSGADFPTDHHFVVRVRLHPRMSWSKVGSLRPDKYGKVYGNFKLPYTGKRISSVYVCLKETTYGYTVCTRAKLK